MQQIRPHPLLPHVGDGRRVSRTDESRLAFRADSELGVVEVEGPGRPAAHRRWR